MRLLVTNTRTAQAYAVIRALRPYAELIVATVAGPRPLGFWPTCSAAYSRLVDRRCKVPDPEGDWHEGHIQASNTEREQAFIDAMLRVCEREKIDTIFPSDDAWVYVLSKNTDVFARSGVLIPIPDYATVIKPIDKYRTVRCAEEVGFPAPRTYLPENEADVRRIAGELGPPWMIKPRFTSGGRGMAVVDDIDDLVRRTRAIEQRHSMPIIQEYIPGRGRQNFYLILDKSGEVWSVFTPAVVRVGGRVLRNDTGACISAPLHPLTEKAISLVRHMGWWGGATVQTKLDARDGQFKLMEVNARLGAALWKRTELGMNEPLKCLKIARGESREPDSSYALGTLLLDPIEDVVNFVAELLDLVAHRFRTSVAGMSSIDPSSPPDTMRKILAAYRQQYFSDADRLYCQYVRYGINDPLPALIWTSKVLGKHSLKKMKGLGR